MRELLSGFIATAALLAVPALAQAEGLHRPEKAAGIRRVFVAGPRFSGLFDALDTNRDSVLDGAELDRTPDFLRKLDRDGDGKTSTRDVFHEVGHFRVPGPRPSAILFGALDTNGDSVLDSAELDQAPFVLRKLDKDGGGRISMREIEHDVQPSRAQRRTKSR